MLKNVVSTDDVTSVIDSLSAHVVFMDIDDVQKGVAFDALQAALKAIQNSQ